MMENKTKIDLKNTSIFITGAAGFIGSNLAKRILTTVEGAKVVGLDNMNHYYDVRLKEARLDELNKFENFSFVKGNLADNETITTIFEQYKPQTVVNLGAQAGVRYSITNPDAYVEANLIGFYNILEACRHSYDEGHTPVEHLVYASSSSVYGSNKKVPYSTDDKVDNPVSLYIISNCNKLYTLYDNNKTEALKHPYLSVVHMIGTFISRKKTNSVAKSRQYRWEHFYKKIIPELTKEYDVAIAYMQREQTYFLVDKVKATKKIAWVHNEYSQLGHFKEMDLEYFEKVDKVVTISDLCAKDLKKNFPSIAEKFVVLPNLTSSQVIRNLAKEFYPPEFKRDVLNIVSIGRLNAQKGFEFALEAALELKKSRVKFHWVVLGIGSLKEELEKKREELGVQDCFEFIGARENPYAYMKNADVLVQSSRFEGKSVVLDEGKILCCPIVTTNYPTVYDQINEDEGVIVGMSGKEIADGIMKILKEPRRYSEYLSRHEYGNEKEIEGYYQLFDLQ